MKTTPSGSGAQNGHSGFLALRGRLHRKSGKRFKAPAITEELASALALADLASGLEPSARLRLLKRASRRFDDLGMDLPSSPA